jgi:hypothetical protein
MTTTPETIEELKRLLAEQTPRNGTLIVAAVNALPSLLADIEMLREALERVATGLSPASIAVQCHGNIAGHDANLVALAGACGQFAMAALAATEVKP